MRFLPHNYSQVFPQGVNVEQFFTEHYSEYKVNTPNHRVLVIPQFYGLITKTPFYKKGILYNAEKTTEVYDELCNTAFGSKEYNIIKTEQLLKVKIRAIIDTADNNSDYNILPIVFAFRVLYDISEQHGISEIPLDSFYTYVMTCSSYSCVSECVDFITNNVPSAPVEIIDKYRDSSRFISMLRNINLFNIDRNSISLNKEYKTYFQSEFMERYDIEELNTLLSNGADYTDFLTRLQGFNIDLVGKPQIPNVTAKKKTKKAIRETSDDDYITQVNKVHIQNINESVAIGADKRQPVVTEANLAQRFSRNPIIGKIALKYADYKCSINPEHKTFISASTHHPYMEPHHLIPISKYATIWERFNVNIDCVENIVSLCPVCHRCIHFATTEEKDKIISTLYNMRLDMLNKLGISISIDELMNMYR